MAQSTPLEHPHPTATCSCHAKHDESDAPAFLPHWLRERWALALVALAGVFLLIGWAGETFFGLPAQVAWAFYLLAYVAGGYDVATHAIPALFRKQLDTDILMLAAAAGAAALGQWAEGALLLFLFGLGHAGEHYALDRARNAVGALGQLMPQVARVRRGDAIVELPLAELRVGDIVLVRPGDRIPADGTIAAGASSIDQSPITGESVPVRKAPGAEVFAGTVNIDASLEIAATRLAQDSTLSRVMRLVAEAESEQSPTQQLTQRFTRWFVPVVLGLTVLVAFVPPLLGLLPLSQSFYRAMLLLVAASPCALAIGTPAAVLAGIAQAARNGVLIKGGAHLESLGAIRAIAFDKTGTLTSGAFTVTDILPAQGVSRAELLGLAAAVEQHSAHPLAQAVVRAAQGEGIVLPHASALENLSGRGVRSAVDGEEVLVGSLDLFVGKAQEGWAAQQIAQLESNGRSTMAVSHDGRLLGVLGLADTPREAAPTTLRQLRELGVQHLVMLTGDNSTAAQRVAATVGVTDTRADLLPEDKLTVVREMVAQHGPVAMIGDGVNDAPALAAASVGIAMGSAGTAVALETADVALMGDDLAKLPFAVGLGRATRAVIRQNLAIALGVIALLIVSTFVGVISLPVAVVLHEGSTVVVVVNALRLLGMRGPTTSIK